MPNGTIGIIKRRLTRKEVENCLKDRYTEVSTTFSQRYEPIPSVRSGYHVFCVGFGDGDVYKKVNVFLYDTPKVLDHYGKHYSSYLSVNVWGNSTKIIEELVTELGGGYVVYDDYDCNHLKKII